MIFTALGGHTCDVKYRNRCLHYYSARCTLFLIYFWCYLIKLGFESDSGDVTIDYLSQQKWRKADDHPPTTTTDQGCDIPAGTVKLITVTRVSAQHVRIVKAKLDDIAQGSVALRTTWEKEV